jgi:hypothetical protein
LSWSANGLSLLQVNFTDEALLQNVSAFVGALLGAKPVGLKKSEFTSFSGNVSLEQYGEVAVTGCSFHDEFVPNRLLIVVLLLSDLMVC